MKFFFYGSLKRGLYNNTILQEKGCTFIKNDTTEPNFQLFSLGAFPAMTTGDKHVAGEIWDIQNDDVTSFIERMEMGAGYYPLKINTLGKETAWTYYMSKERAKKLGTPCNEWPIKDQSKHLASHEAHRTHEDPSRNYVEQ